MRNAGQRSTFRASTRRWALLAYWAAMFIATHWPEIDRYKPEGGWPIPRFSLVAHLGIYAGWAVMWWWLLAADGRTVSRAVIVWLILGGAAYAGFDEISQAIVERTPAIPDFLADLAGMLAVIAAASVRQAQRSRIPRRQTSRPST